MKKQNIKAINELGEKYLNCNMVKYLAKGNRLNKVDRAVINAILHKHNCKATRSERRYTTEDKLLQLINELENQPKHEILILNVPYLAINTGQGVTKYQAVIYGTTSSRQAHKYITQKDIEAYSHKEFIEAVQDIVCNYYGVPLLCFKTLQINDHCIKILKKTFA